MKIDRLITIITLLLEHKRISAKTLAEMFEVSLRTIYRDIETINQAGIPITSTPGTGGGFNVLETYKIDKNIFTPSELAFLLSSINSLSSAVTLPQTTALKSKLNRLIPEQHSESIHLTSEQIEVDLMPWKGNKTLLTNLKLIQTALHEHTLISFDYINNLQSASSRTVEPHKLLLKSLHWYLVAYCRNKQQFRLFKLSRISNLKKQPICFTPHKTPDLKTEFIQTMKQKEIAIQILIDKNIKDQILDYCNHEHIQEYNTQYLLVELPFIDDEQGYSLLLSFGAKCICLSPQPVKEELIRRAQALLKQYGQYP